MLIIGITLLISLLIAVQLFLSVIPATVGLLLIPTAVPTRTATTAFLNLKPLLLIIGISATLFL